MEVLIKKGSVGGCCGPVIAQSLGQCSGADDELENETGAFTDSSKE